MKRLSQIVPYFWLCVAAVVVQLAVPSALVAQQRQQLKVPDHVQVDRDVVYADRDGLSLTLDIAYPRNLTEDVPAVVHIHGGAWRSGRKSAAQAIRYAKLGWVGVSIDYRLSGVAKFPAGVHDCKAVIRWLRANAAKYHIDGKRIGAFGSSAGGHLVALLGTSHGDSFLEGTENPQHSSAVQAVVDHFGPTDFLRMNDAPGSIDHDAANSPESQWIGGPIQENAEQVARANPITYVDANDPPILMIHGDMDQLVIYGQSELLFIALVKVGVRSKLVPVLNAGHSYRPQPPGATISPSRAEIQELEVEWFRKYLASAPAD